MAEKVLKEGHDDIVKAEKELDGIVGEIVGDISKAIHKNEKKEKEQAPVEQEVVESVATEETTVVETPIVEMAPPVVEEPVIEEPVEEPIIEEEIIVEEEEDLFTVEETEAMKALAEMGRVFDDEDEAKLIKLTEDLTAWINKYAPTFDDPEALLFEVTSSLITEDMEQGKQEDEPIIQPESAFEQSSAITITFSFGDNQDWFIFEQTLPQPQEQQEFEIVYDFDIDNVWA